MVSAQCRGAAAVTDAAGNAGFPRLARHDGAPTILLGTMAATAFLDTPRERIDGAAGATLAVMHPAEPAESSIRSASRGDPVALDDVLRAYLPRLQRFVHLRLGAALRGREDTVDIVQSTVRELLAEERFEWRGEPEFRGWLFQAAVNKIREKARFHGRDKRDAAREVGADDASEAFGEALRDLTTPSRVAIAREETERLERAFAALTEPQREVVSLARIAGLPHATIAARLGKSEVAVRQLLVRALTALGKSLDAD